MKGAAMVTELRSGRVNSGRERNFLMMENR
jgi:hypothetical protein